MCVCVLLFSPLACIFFLFCFIEYIRYVYNIKLYLYIKFNWNRSFVRSTVHDTKIDILILLYSRTHTHKKVLAFFPILFLFSCAVKLTSVYVYTISTAIFSISSALIFCCCWKYEWCRFCFGINKLHRSIN